MGDTIIEVFEGRLGGGKTYSAVERIFNHLLRGGIVYTNIILKWDVIKTSALNRGYVLDDNQYQYLNNDKVREFNKHIAAGTDAMPVLVILDEAHLFFNARDWNKVGRVILDLLTQMRKVSCNLILITQSQHNLDKQFVRMIQFFWRFRDMRKVTLPILGIPYPFNQIMQVCFDAQDSRHEMKRWTKFKDKEVFSWYESKALFTDLGMLLEAPKVNMRRLSRREMWNHRRASFSRIRSDLTKNLKPAQIVKLLLIIIVLLGAFAVSIRYLTRGSRSDSATVAQNSQNQPSASLASATQRVFGGDASNSKKDVQFYHSNLTVFVPGFGYLRAGGRAQGQVITSIDPIRRIVFLSDGADFGY